MCLGCSLPQLPLCKAGVSSTRCLINTTVCSEEGEVMWGKVHPCPPSSDSWMEETCWAESQISRHRAAEVG